MITVRAGDRISEYILEEPLGRGGFGEVWRARHHQWRDRVVAVKVPTHPDAIRDLSNEGIIHASLDHPGVARCLGMDTSADPPYFVVEFVPGISLREHLRQRGRLPVMEVRAILEQILDVLEYAHTRGVVHQDIKPENIILTPEGSVKLTDFGLGHTVAGHSILLSASLRTDAGPTGGTIGYIAPEIRDGQGGADARSDLYSVAILLFELLTGRRPAGAESPSELVPGLPPWCDLVFRGLYTRREARFASAEEVRAAMGAGPPPVPTPAGSEPPADAGGADGGARDANPPPTEQLGREVGTASASRPVGARSRPSKTVAAGLFVRGCAAVLDVAPVMILFTLILLLRIRLGGAHPGLIFLMSYSAYLALTHALWGRTLAKTVLGLKVVRTDGRSVGPLRALARALLFWASVLPLGFGLWIVPFQRSKRALHDLLAGTRVIYHR
ncbi:MAG: protein kinase domain-containing protein [Planctomycetota bacterium]|jgi:serine/threonine protein kinase